MTAALVLLAGLSPAAPVPEWARRPNPQSEFRKLEGRWVYARAVYGGQEHPADPNFEVAFAAGGMTGRSGGQLAQRAKVVIDPAADPRRITYLVTHRPDPLGAELRLEGVYALDGDVLTMVNYSSHQGFPDQVDPRGGPGVDVIVLRRVREVAPPPRPARRDPR